jgi:hypothetical protein
LLLYFAFTLFVSATLLFLVQPMVGKMVLPRLGGTPAVWNTCMVFFQAVLLVGYAYTHTLSTWQSRRRQILLQLAILLLPFLVLPISLGNWSPPAEHNPVLSVLWLLLGMVGLPFFVVATSAPLLQRWFSATGHRAARDPYFLYGASNLGSMLALLLYPVLIEPYFTLGSQTLLWTAGYGLLVLLVAGCGIMVWRQPAGVQAVPAPVAAKAAPSAPSAPQTAVTAAPSRRSSRFRVPAAAHEPVVVVGESRVSELAERGLTLGRRLRWIGLAAAPTSLMLGVTTYLTTDIAAIPLILIVPLALYLLTFILAFARWPVVWVGVPHTVLLLAQPCLLMFLILLMVAHVTLPSWLPPWTEGALHVAVFFTTALVCHGELAKDRPAARHLTDFYLCMSAGGVLGGMFNALVAPQLFRLGVTEYYLAMMLACVLRPNILAEKPLIPGDSNKDNATLPGRVLDVAIPVGIGVASYYMTRLGASWSVKPYFMAAGAVMVLALAGHSVRFGLALGFLILGVEVYNRGQDPFIFEDRSFFGFVKVRKTEEAHRVVHTLVHGGINHGSQIVEPEHRRRETITYFHPTGGIGQIFKKFSWPDARLPASLVGLGTDPLGVMVGLHSEPPYAVVGLGTGILAAHAKPGQHVVFYEIDPLVMRLSVPPEGEDPPYFYYVQDARDRGANLEIILGDGRLTLQKDPHVNPLGPKENRKLERYYHIIVLDAFSSDAIPVHLLTAEAIDLYLEKLADGGVLVFNVTNRYVDISPVLGRIAQEKGLTCLSFGDYSKDEEGNEVPDKFGSDWVVIQRKDYAKGRRLVNGGPPLEERLNMKRWEPTSVLDGPIWTDNYSNLLRVINW